MAMDYSRAAEWIVAENEFNPEYLGKCESIMCQGNGYLCLRNATDEYNPGEQRDLFVAGTFNKFDDNEVTELPNAADVSRLDLRLDGVRFSLLTGKVESYDRALTISFSAVVVPCQTIIALIIASVLNSKIRGKYFFRTVYFLPTLTSSSALTIIFMFSVTGPINTMLIRAGILAEGGGINFLNDPSFALKVIMVMNIWSTVPQYTTMYLASLQDLPVSLYEAAEIDGADTLQKFKNITVPYLKPITTYVLLTGIIGTLQMFDQAYIFSNGSGGPANSTLTVSLMVYRYAFGTNNAMGYASSIAIILALVIMAVSLIAEKLNDAERWY